MTSQSSATAQKKNAVATTKDWTVMVYLAGDNNLSEDMIFAIKEIYRVGVTEEFDTIVQFDPSGIGAPVRRYVISAINGAPITPPLTTGGSHVPTVVPQDQEDGELDEHAILLEEKAFTPRAVPGGMSVRAKLARAPRKRTLGNEIENSADPVTLKEFILTSIDEHDAADHYMVILSGHGSGTLGDFLLDDRRTGDKPRGDEPPSSSLSIPSLGWVFERVRAESKKLMENEGQKEAGKIDIVGMDSCLMSMAEVCYQLRKDVVFLVGSEGFVLGTGWPYHRILETLRKKSGDLPNRVAEEIVKDYIRYYSDYDVIGASTDQAACNLEIFSKKLLPVFRKQVTELQSGLVHRVIKNAILLAHWESQSYKGEQYTDLYDFCDRLQKRCEYEQDLLKTLRRGELAYSQLPPDKKKQVDEALPGHNDKTKEQWELLKDQLDRISSSCSEVKIAIQDNKDESKRVVLKSCYSGAAFQHSHGLSLYFPWSEDNETLESYEQLEFAKDVELDPDTGNETGTGWATFLRKYLEVTRRERRNEANHGERRLVRIDPPPESVDSLPVLRVPGHGTRGLNFGVGSMKNPPDGFYPDECER